MKRRRIDSVLLGGAVALSGVMQRRVEDLERREIDRRARAAAPPPLPPAPQAPPAASIPGMPLPTGYGLQVRGPHGESIVLPVCLPPGFELDSMMLCPEFLPRVEARDAAPARPHATLPGTAPSFAGTPAPPVPSVPTAAAAAAPARHAAPPARPARADAQASAGRLDGVLQLVFGADQRFSSSLEHSEDALSSEPARGSPSVPESARHESVASGVPMP
jgi:hypothetical protein